MTTQPILVIGTAGHIDHGKSRLVNALTGTDPDRLPEEKQRGLTIELGFAHCEIDGCRISFVDVPGHERFIRNMVAGATGIDAALLVVAADDSVMPQTREHAEVLSLLGVRRVILAISKTDLVDEEWAEIVEAEAHELLASLDLDLITSVRTSAETGQGLDQLRTVLARLAHEAAPPTLPYHWFRMAIDRAFSVAGRGTVVTGTAAHGSLTRDSEVDLWPAGNRVRARDIHLDRDKLDSSTGRARLGINLAGVTLDDVGRGREIATTGYLAATQLCDVWIASLRMPGKIIRQRIRLRLHIGTSDVLAELRLITRPDDRTCRAVFGQLRVAEPIVATWGQTFILRDEAAKRTLGGGRVLRPTARRWTTRRPADPDSLATLLEGKPRDRLAEVIRHHVWNTFPSPRLSAEAGLADADDAERTTRSLIDKALIVPFDAASNRLLVHVTNLERLTKLLNEKLRTFVAENPRLAGVPRTEWPNWMPKACPPRFRPLLADWLISNEHVLLHIDHVVPIGFAGALPPSDQQLYDALLAELHAGAFQPPGIDALNCHTPANDARLRELVDLATNRGDLIRITDGIWLHSQRWTELTERVSAALRERGQITVSEIRTLLDSSRKYVVPIAECLDAAGITKRLGDYRTTGPNAP